MAGSNAAAKPTGAQPAGVQLGGAPPIVAEVTPAAVEALGLGAGSSVWVAVKATEIRVSAG